MSRQLYLGWAHPAKADQGYGHLQSLTACGDLKKGGSEPILTKTDAKFEATKHLYITASYPINIVKVLGE